jgi:GNAT superfamily N-acetyltransferase
MNKITIRGFNPSKDSEAIYQITKDSWTPIYNHRKREMDLDIFHSIYKDGPFNKANNVLDWCIKNPSNVAISEIEGSVVGFITWEEANKDTVELSNNAVAPKEHRQGIASFMYTWFLEEMKNRGYLYTFVFTGLDSEHEPCRRAYEKVGFTMPVELVRYYKKL